MKYTYGDITATKARYICHCVNAQGVMRSGVAKAIRAKFPKAYDVYRDKFEREGLVLGSVIGADCGSHTILNLVGQQYYGREFGRIYVSYRALRKGISLINANITEPVAFPMIGCGLAGGDWQIVSKIIE